VDYQVSVVGGGISGALAALYLGKSRVKTCLNHRGKPSQSLSNQ